MAMVSMSLGHMMMLMVLVAPGGHKLKFNVAIFHFLLQLYIRFHNSDKSGFSIIVQKS
jgi:hypothetical protein